MATRRLSTSAALIGGTLVAGSCDITFAILFWWFRAGVGPTRVLQSVASVSFCIVLVYWLAAKALPVLRRHAVILGSAYGIAVYFVMNYVVIPLSATKRGPFNLLSFVLSLIVHAFLIGLPAALFVKAALPESES